MSKIVTIQAFTSDRYRVPKSISSRLPKGQYTPYVVAQEGQSTPYSLAEGKTTVLNWGRDLIKSLVSKFRGVKFFNGHGKGTNSHNGREEVGRAVEVYLDEIDGKLSTVAILPGAFSEDVCSMEAKVENNSNGEVTKVYDITAVAIADSRSERPAFPGAVSLGQIQCFSEEITMRRDNGEVSFIQCFDKDGEGSGGGRDYSLQLSFEQLKKEVRTRDLWPREIFSVDKILGDRELAPKIKEALMKDSVTKEEFDTLKKTHDEALEELNTFRDKDRQKVVLDQIDKAISKRRYTEKQKTFIEMWKEEGMFDDVDPADPAAIKMALEKGEQKYMKYKKKGIVIDKESVDLDDDDDDGKKSDDSVQSIMDEMEI